MKPGRIDASRVAPALSSPHTKDWSLKTHYQTRAPLRPAQVPANQTDRFETDRSHRPFNYFAINDPLGPLALFFSTVPRRRSSVSEAYTLVLARFSIELWKRNVWI